MKTKVSELTGEKLAEWTARAQEWEWRGTQCGDSKPYWRHPSVGYICDVAHYRPDINGAQAMELFKVYWQEFVIYMHKLYGKYWENAVYPKALKTLICQAVVASVYGEYVEDT